MEEGEENGTAEGSDYEVKASGNPSTEVATLGGGCFWCIEAVFSEVRGVLDVQSGYSGGSSEDATYERVCTGTTGHAEVVQVTFDPQVITFEEVLEVFFHSHDPTTPNRQGVDVGTQYRSIIFYHSEEQRIVANDVIRQIESSGLWDKPIVTEVVPLVAFYRAEEYHDDYYKNNENQPYCRLVITPKVEKLRKSFPGKVKE